MSPGPEYDATGPEDLIAPASGQFENNLTRDAFAPSGCSLQGRAKPIGQAKFRVD